MVFDIDSGSLEQLVMFLKTDKVPNMKDYAYSLGLIAEEYNIPLLAKQVQRYLVLNCTTENFTQVIHLAYLFSSKELCCAVGSLVEPWLGVSFVSLEYDMRNYLIDYENIKLVSKDGKEFSIGKFLFMARSHKLRDMVPGGSVAKEEIKVKFDDIDSGPLEQLVHFLKTDRVAKMKEYAISLGEISHEYNLPLLFKLVEIHFIGACTEENFRDVIYLAHLHRSKILCRAVGKLLNFPEPMTLQPKEIGIIKIRRRR